MSDDALPGLVGASTRIFISPPRSYLNNVLDDQIAHTEPAGVLDMLHLHRLQQSAEEEIYQYLTSISPQRKLPNELLSEIFILCISGPVSIPLNVSQIPWILGRVCSKWRRVSRTLQILWNNVEFTCADSTATVSYAQRIQAANTILSLSPSLLLSLKVMGSRHYHLQQNPITDLVIPYSNRIRNLSIGALPVIIRLFLYFPRGSFNVLENLTISIVNFERSATSMVFGQKFQDLSITFSSPDAYVPWHQLTKFVLLAETSHDTALSILRHCPHLVECSLCIYRRRSQRPQVRVNRITLPSLLKLSLELKFSYPEHISNPRFIEYLFLPGLREFTIFTANDTPTWNSADTPGFAHYGSLKKLHLGVRIRSDDLLRILEGTPSLIELNILGSPISFHILSRIICGKLLPKLAILRCVAGETFTQHLNLLEGYLKTTPVTNIKSEFMCRFRPNLVTLERIRRLQDAGLDIKLIFK